jgi:hypothetical protein
VSSPQPSVVAENNLSLAWSRAFMQIIDHGGTEIRPAMLSFSGFQNGEPQEEPGVRVALDNALNAVGQQSIETVANTIFPASVWRRAKYDRHELYRIYLDALPRYVALAKSKNWRGLYFARLIAYGVDPATGTQLPHMPAHLFAENGNQLEFIISEYAGRRGVRRSLLQAALFDPMRDHVRSAQLCFPCLQQLAFDPWDDGTLAVSAFYATQQVFTKAYGNLLGICRLGHFMAHEMGLRLGRVNCYVGVEKLDGIAKGSPILNPLIRVARTALEIGGETQQTTEP